MKLSIEGISKALSALGDTMEFLGSIEQGMTFSREQHQHLKEIAACAHSHLHGLIPVFQLMSDMYQNCRASQVPLKAAHNRVGREEQPTPQATRSYRDAARTPAQRQRTEQTRAIRRHTQEIKAQIRCDERSFHLCPVSLKGDRPSFRQLGISLERKLKIQNLEACIEDIRSDQGGRFFIQIRDDYRKSFEKALDRSLECTDARWNLELEDLSTFEVNNPHTSPTRDKIPVVIGNVDTDIEAEAAIEAIVEQNAARWNLPSTELLDSHLAPPHGLNRRKRDAFGQPLSDWIPSRNLKVFVSKALHEKLFAEHKSQYAKLDCMVLLICPFVRFPSVSRGNT